MFIFSCPSKIIILAINYTRKFIFKKVFGVNYIHEIVSRHNLRLKKKILKINVIKAWITAKLWTDYQTMTTNNKNCSHCQVYSCCFNYPEPGNHRLTILLWGLVVVERLFMINKDPPNHTNSLRFTTKWESKGGQFQWMYLRNIYSTANTES